MFHQARGEPHSKSQPRLAFSASDIETICRELAPDGESPVIIFGRESEALVLSKLADDYRASSSLQSEAELTRIQQSFCHDWTNYERVKAPFSCQLNCLNERLIFLPGFDTHEGILTTLRTFGAECYMFQRANFGFLDSSPDRIMASCLQIIRHEARHLVKYPLDDTKKEMMCDAVALLYGLADSVKSQERGAEGTFRAQCDEHARYRGMCSAFDGRYEFTKFVALRIRDYREGALSLGRENIEMIANAICMDIWHQHGTSSWDENQDCEFGGRDQSNTHR